LANQIYKKLERVLDETNKGHMYEDRLHTIVGILLGKIKIGLEENDRKLLGLLLSLDKVKKSDLNVLFQCSVKRDGFKAYA
jgi:pseudouridine-5'-phosphate glycosidase